MKITCPSCTATYEVPEAVLAARRPVRCARCGNNWVPEAETAIAAPVAIPVTDTPALPVAPDAPPVMSASSAVIEPEPAAAHQKDDIGAASVIDTMTEERLPPQAPSPPVATKGSAPVAETVAPQVKAPVAAWAASVALLLVLALSAIAFRGAIMKTWPPSQRLYAAIGLYHR